MKSQATNNIPEKIGKYRVEGVLGRGAMGVVYRAFDPYIKRKVAIKTVHKSLLDTDLSDEVLARFGKEAEAVGRLAHPNIVPIYDFDQFDGQPYFVMEFVEGRELKALIRRKQPMSLERAIPLIVAVLEGLEYTHQLGIIHRDIKPANIFVLDDDRVKIADFGIARLESSEYTQMGRVLGTPSYMSPEQCQGALLDARSDLFSVAVMLYEMLTGQKAFVGTDSQDTMRKVVQEPFRSLPVECVEEWPTKLLVLLEKGLAKKPQDRFQTATEFKSDLLQLLPSDKKVLKKGQERGWYRAWALRAVVALAAIMMGSVVMLLLREWVPGTADQIDGASSTTAIEKRELTPSEQDKVSRILKVAKAHLLVQRLVAPQGSNAYDAYQLVLKMDPGNQAALSGLQLVEDKLVRRIEALKGEGKRAEAKSYHEMGEQLFPSSAHWKKPL